MLNPMLGSQCVQPLCIFYILAWINKLLPLHHRHLPALSFEIPESGNGINEMYYFSVASIEIQALVSLLEPTFTKNSPM